jgi:hypothetical protein
MAVSFLAENAFPVRAQGDDRNGWVFDEHADERLQTHGAGDEVGFVVDDSAGGPDVQMGIGAPTRAFRVIVVGQEFATVPVKEGIDILGSQDLEWLELRIRFAYAKAVDQIKVEPLPCEPYRLLLRERERMILVEP